MTVEQYVSQLDDPLVEKWFAGLVDHLRVIASKDSNSQPELKLVDAIFKKYVPRGAGARDALFYALDRLACK